MFKNVLVLVIFTLFSLCYATYKDCGSEAGTLSQLDIPGCANDDPFCILRRDTNATVKITFVAKKNIEKINALVHGVILDVPVVFILPNSDGCLNSGLTCPLETGQSYTYIASLPVLKKYPRLSLRVKWELLDEENKDIICLLIPAKIQ